MKRVHTSAPAPMVLAARELPLGLGRVLELRLVQDSEMRRDCWLRLRTASGTTAGALRLPPRTLRPLAQLLEELAE